MSTERKGTEIFVGLFLVIGFCFIAVMVVLFGRVGMGAKGVYQITIEFPNASGLVSGSDVLLAGARIGTVEETPKLLGSSYRVEVKLNIQQDVNIPKESKFVVGSSGLLGDRYVDVHLKENFDPTQVIEHGARVAGVNPGGGLSELTDKGGEVMDQLTIELEKISEMLTKVNQGVLHERNLKNIEETFANLKTATENFKKTTADLDVLVDKAGGVMDAAKGTMATADGAASDLRNAIAELHKMADSATKTVDSTRALVKKAAEGEGTVGALINDRKMAEDLKSLIANLRKSGVLFYRDRPPLQVAPKPGPSRAAR